MKIYSIIAISFFSCFFISFSQGVLPGAVQKPSSAIRSVTATPAIPFNASTIQVLPEKKKGLGENTCSSYELTKKYYESIGKWEEFNQMYLEEAQKTKPFANTKTPGVNTIAVIFHVVHNPNNPAENVSNAAIMHGMTVQI